MTQIVAPDAMDSSADSLPALEQPGEAQVVPGAEPMEVEAGDGGECPAAIGNFERHHMTAHMIGPTPPPFHPPAAVVPAPEGDAAPAEDPLAGNYTVREPLGVGGRLPAAGGCAAQL